MKAVIFLLKKIRTPLLRVRAKSTSIVPIPMPASTAWTEGPKGALMQTSFACVRDVASLKPCTGAFRPCDPDQPCAGWMPGTRRRSITTKGGGPLPLPPAQPCAGWIRGMAFAPCTTTGAVAPATPITGRSGSPC